MCEFVFCDETLALPVYCIRYEDLRGGDAEGGRVEETGVRC